MNLLGKIFTLLIFIMSLVFMSFAVAVYSTHKNWREMVMLSPEEATRLGKPVGLKWQLQQAQKLREEVENQRARLEEELKAEKAARQNDVSKLKEELAEMRTANKKLEDDIKEVTLEKNKATQALGEITALNKKLADDTTDLWQKWMEAKKERDEISSRLTTASVQLRQAEGELARLKEKLVQVGKQYTDALAVLQLFGLNSDPDYYKVATVQGMVTAVRANGLVEISIGADDGVRKGGVLRVIRADGSMYLGQIEVLETQPDRAVCRIVPGSQQGAIQPGDKVRSDLSDVLTSSH
jgi:myosin heavy subunit